MNRVKNDHSESDDSGSNNYLEKKHSRRFSRSRSPNQNYKSQDFHKRRSKIVSQNEDLYKEKLELLADKKQLMAEIKDAKKTIEAIKGNLEGYKSNALIFLPCTHQKIVNIKHKQMLDSAFDKAIHKLNEDELKNEICLRQLRSKIFYNIESRYPEIFKCTHPEKYTNEKCGHSNIAECHDIKKFIKVLKYPACNVKVEHTFKCDHTENTECHLSFNTLCSKCS